MIVWPNLSARDRHAPLLAGAGLRVLVWSAVAGLVVGALIWMVRKSARESDPVVSSRPPLQGEAIVPLNTNPVALGPASNRFGFAPGTLTNLSLLAATNTALGEVTGLSESGKRARRQRPKPGSYPKRMMDLQLRLLSEGKDPQAFDTNTLPAGLVLTNLPAPAVEGYLPVSFELLAGFDFELSSELVQGPTNGSAKGPALARLPPQIRALSGRKAAVSGFLLPMVMDEGRAVEFLLMRDQTLCCYGRIPRLNEWISVRATGRGAKPRMDVPLTVCGTFTVSEQRESGTLIGLYQMQAEQLIESD